MRKFVLIVLAAQLTACAGRAPAPVAVVQSQDKHMDCAAINAEVQANNKKITELGSEEGGKVAQNVIAGAAGLFIPVLWFAMDFQNAAGKEVSALQSGQQYLATMAEQRCGAAPPVPDPDCPASDRSGSTGYPNGGLRSGDLSGQGNHGCLVPVAYDGFDNQWRESGRRAV